MSPKPNASKSTDRPELLPQTSDDKFKQSSFATLAKSASPFGGLASPGSQSPFGAASGNKLSSFAGSTAAPAAPASGFGGFGSSATSGKSAFGGSAFGSSSGGGSTFGSSLGGGFGAISGSKSALSSFETPTDLTIKGLKSKATAFGTPGNGKEAEGSDDEEESDPENDDEDEKRLGQPLLSQQRTFHGASDRPFANTIAAQETGEEGEESKWQGRAKLYTMAVEGSTKAWKERGVGTFKFNVTVDEPKKARFVLRADGTHRLLLNAAVTRQLVFGGDSEGGKPKDGRLLFNTPTADGELEMHLLRVSRNICTNMGFPLTIRSSKPNSPLSSGKRSARFKRRSYRIPPLSALQT
jgi:Ran-binding protein 3